MGIFSNRCEALVNPVTGKALYGESLEKARLDPNWPRCGHSVKKSAHVCSMCGAPAPGGWIRCPACGKWAGNDSRFCPHCNTPLYPGEQTAMADGRWVRSPEIFAQRIEVKDIAKDEGLIVQEGTVAILLDGGEVKDVLEAGRYNLDGLARKINWFNNPPPRSVVLLDSGEIAVPVAFDNVVTKSKEAIKFYGEVVIRFTGGKEAARNFVSNVLKGNRSLSFADIVDRFDPLFRLAVEDVCSRATSDELFSRKSERRAELRDMISRLLEDDLQATGLDVVRVSSGEFVSAAYERRLQEEWKLEQERQKFELEQRGDLDEHEREKRRKEIEQRKWWDWLDQRRREEEFKDEQRTFEEKLALGKFKDEQDFRRAKAALEDEYNLGEIDRQATWKRLMEKRADEESSHQRERDKVERAYREQEEEEARQKAEIQRVREEKERDEAVIRRKAALDRQWEVTDKLNARVKEEEIRRFCEAEERRTRRWEAVREEQRRLWEAKKEKWRQEDEERERQRREEREAKQHALRLRQMELDAQVEARVKVTASRNQEEIDAAKKDVAIEGIKNDGKLEQTLKWDDVHRQRVKELEAQRGSILLKRFELRKQMQVTADEDVRKMIWDDYNSLGEDLKSVTTKLKELGT